MQTRDRALPLSVLLLAAFLAWLLGLVAPRRASAAGTVDLLVQLNGTPVRAGVLTSTGASVSATVAAGVPLLVVCDAKAHVGVQATCAAGYTSAAFCVPQAADESRYLIPNGTTLSAISSAGTANCAYFTMR